MYTISLIDPSYLTASGEIEFCHYETYVHTVADLLLTVERIDTQFASAHCDAHDLSLRISVSR